MLLALLLSLQVASAESASPDQTAKTLLAFVGHVPGGAKLQCLAKDYLTVLGADPSAFVATQANGGLIRFLQAHYGSAPPEEVKRTREFYDDVRAKISAQQYPVPEHHTDAYEGPTMKEAAGSGKYSALEPGWVWDLAMKHAQGDPNQATRMIAVCGHDDTMQEPFQFPNSEEEKQRLLDDRNAWIDRMVARLRENAKNATPNFKHQCNPDYVPVMIAGANDLDKKRDYYSELVDCNDPAGVPAEIAALRKYQATLNTHTFDEGRIDCPTGFANPLEAYYLPKSLGSSVEISDSLKDSIAEMQAPFTCMRSRDSDPQDCLPAKHYHVYGAAMVACEMIARGHGKALVQPLAEALAFYYRAYWLESVATKCDDRTFDDDGALTPKKVSAWSNLLAEVRSLGYRYVCRPNQLVDALDDGATPSDREPCDQATGDAIYLMRKWSMLGKPGAMFGSLLPNLGSFDVPAGDQPANWSRERFELARAKVKSFKSDFAWTIAQHKLGARFAAEHCKPDPELAKRNSCRN